MAPRPSKRMAANDNEYSFPTPVRGELPVPTNFSNEQAWQRKVHLDFLHRYKDQGKLFWPHNRVVPEISWAPEPCADDPQLFCVKLFADIFIKPRKVPDETGKEWTKGIDLISRTVLQPATRIHGSVVKGPEFPHEEFYNFHFNWNLYWSPTRDLDHVRILDPAPVHGDLPFRTLEDEIRLPMTPSGPFGFGFILRRGAEDDVVVIKRGTVIAHMRISDIDDGAQ